MERVRDDIFKKRCHHFEMSDVFLQIIFLYYDINKQRIIMIFVFLILAFFVPRISILLLWFFTNWFNGVFQSILWPIIGFIFLPATTLWYSVVFNWFDNSWSAIPIIGLVICLLIDLSPAGGRKYRRDDTL